MNVGGPFCALAKAGGLVGFLFFFCFSSSGGDWPQYRGPTHDGVSTDRIYKVWTGSITTFCWRVLLSNGLSSLAVTGGRVFTQHQRTTSPNVTNEFCVALNTTYGQELWATLVDSGYYPNGGVGNDDGPRTTPAVNDSSVFVLTTNLKLIRLNVTNGAIVWQKDLRALYGSANIGWQNAASPLLDDDLIFLNTNTNRNGASLAAFRTSDGSIAWTNQNPLLTHSTPTLATIQGVRQVIFATANGLYSLERSTGAFLWRFNYPFNYSTSIGASPVVYQDMVFVTGAHAYGMGSFVVQVSLSNDVWTTTRLWATNNPASHWMTPVCYQGFLYGQFGIQSFDSVNAQLKCIDMRTGVVKWSVDGYGRGATILVDDHLLTLTERGQLVLSKPNTNGYTELARMLAIPYWSDPTNKCWNSPAVSDGRVYVRSTSYCACFDLSVPNLKLDPPEVIAPDKLRLTVRTVNRTPVNPIRVTNMELRASEDISQRVTNWAKLTNYLQFSNGTVCIDNVDSGAQTSRVFIIREAK